MGYHRAGFEVVGVDIKPQPHYPFPFILGDALEILARMIEGERFLASDGKWYGLDDFDAIHASPPCQAYSCATHKETRKKHPDLYEPTRDSLTKTGKPFVIENVIGAPYNQGIILCGSMFGLKEGTEWIQRHRNFETSWMVFRYQCSHPKGYRPLLVTGKSFVLKAANYGRHSRQGPFDLACRLMGIDWMNRQELPQAIPPAYTEFIGRELMKVLNR